MQMQVCETRTIKCPLCAKGKLIDASKHIPPSKISTYPPLSTGQADYFVKCPNCKTQIGIAINR